MAALLTAPAACGVSALVDPETGGAVAGARLVHPPGYLLLAPVTTTLDQLTLLSAPQHTALLVTVLAAVAAWRLVWCWRRRMPGGRGLWGGVAGGLAWALGGIAGLYALLVLARRPMAALTVDDPDVAVVDFHSHTAASHDGRRGFTLAANRAWHEATGFDAAYVTDHRRGGAAAPVIEGNPPRTGGRVVLLPGAEAVYRRQHLVGLGERGVPGDAGDRADPARATASARPIPTLIQTIPEDLARVPAALARGAGALVAVELADGAPRGIDQSARERGRILALADSLDLALVSGSNNHGWAGAATGWSLLRLPGWRGRSPASLDSMIRRSLHQRRRHAARLVVRRAPRGAATPLGRAATAPAFVWSLLATLSPAERLVWVAWSWTAILLVHLRRRRSGSTGTATRRTRSLIRNGDAMAMVAAG